MAIIQSSNQLLAPPCTQLLFSMAIEVMVTDPSVRLERPRPRKNKEPRYTAGSCPASVLLIEAMQQLYRRLLIFSALPTKTTKH
jgi:hypothetical protein